MRRRFPARTLALMLALAAAPDLTAQPRPRAQPNRIEKLRRLSPSQRKKALEALPPDRRQQTEQRLRKLDTMPPAQREALERRYEAFQNLPAQQQQQARKIFRSLNALPADRRDAVRSEMDALRALTPEDRATRLQTPVHRKLFSPKEHSILDDFATLLQAPATPDSHF